MKCCKPAEWIQYIAIYLGLPSECQSMACLVTSDIFTKECQHLYVRMNVPDCECPVWSSKSLDGHISRFSFDPVTWRKGRKHQLNLSTIRQLGVLWYCLTPVPSHLPLLVLGRLDRSRTGIGLALNLPHYPHLPSKLTPQIQATPPVYPSAHNLSASLSHPHLLNISSSTHKPSIGVFNLKY